MSRTEEEVVVERDVTVYRLEPNPAFREWGIRARLMREEIAELEGEYADLAANQGRRCWTESVTTRKVERTVRSPRQRATMGAAAGTRKLQGSVYVPVAVWTTEEREVCDEGSSEKDVSRAGRSVSSAERRYAELLKDAPPATLKIPEKKRRTFTQYWQLWTGALVRDLRLRLPDGREHRFEQRIVVDDRFLKEKDHWDARVRGHWPTRDELARDARKQMDATFGEDLQRALAALVGELREHALNERLGQLSETHRAEEQLWTEALLGGDSEQAQALRHALR